MARVMVGVRPEAAVKLRSLARRKRVSKQGLMSVLIHMANSEMSECGIIDLDWDAIRKTCPTTATRNKRNWDIVVESVKALLDEFDTAEEIAMHTRWTVAQVERAMKELGKC